MFYLIIFFIILLFSFMQLYSVEKNEIQLSNVFFYGVIFLFIILGGFRYETGGDWPGYKAMYTNSDDRLIEPLFSGILQLSRLCGDYQWIFVFCEIIRFVILAVILEKNDMYDKKYKMFFLLLYYVMYWFYYDLVIIRQSTAAAIFALGVLRKEKLKYKEYFFYVLLASGFHFSSLFLLVMYYPLYNMKKKVLMTVDLVLIVSFLFGIDLTSTLLTEFLTILPQNYLVRRLWAYTQIAELATSRKLSGQSMVYLLIFFVMLFDEYIMKRKLNKLFFNGYCLFIFLYFGFPSLSTISTRLSTFYSIFSIFIVIDIIKFYRKTYLIPVILIVLCFCFNKGIFFELPDKVAYNPYQFYWTYTINNKTSDGYERLQATNKANN